MKFSKKQLDLLWPTLSDDYKIQIYALALKGLADLTAEIGYTLTEKHNGIIAEQVKAKKTKKLPRIRHRNIRIHDRVFKDPQAVATFYKCSRANVSRIIAAFGVENIGDHFKKMSTTMIKSDEATFAGGA